MRKWKQTSRGRWESDDGAVVRIDHTTECSTSCPWLPNYRGWMAFKPGPMDVVGTQLVFARRNTWMKVTRKWKTAEAAMAVVDEEYPYEKLVSADSSR